MPTIGNKPDIMPILIKVAKTIDASSPTPSNCAKNVFTFCSLKIVTIKIERIVTQYKKVVTGAEY
jgi:hypothetical protein